MLCKKPFTKGVMQHGCGQCFPCRINRRRIWTSRIMLEAVAHPAASFVNIDYAPAHLPEGGNLCKPDLQKFLKRVRKNVGPCRFYACGEYGELRGRPHYHIALFGHGPEKAEELERCWNLGRCVTGTLTMDSAQYVAGYVMKKMTNVSDKRLAGRYPEFACMSLRPGIGAVSLATVAAALQNKHGWDEIGAIGDVPTMLSSGRKTMPLGRYMRARLRLEMEWENVKEPEVAAFIRSQKMLDVYRSYLDPEEGEFQLWKGKEAFDKAEKEKAVKLEARARATKRTKKL